MSVKNECHSKSQIPNGSGPLANTVIQRSHLKYICYALKNRPIVCAIAEGCQSVCMRIPNEIIVCTLHKSKFRQRFLLTSNVSPSLFFSSANGFSKCFSAKLRPILELFVKCVHESDINFWSNELRVWLLQSKYSFVSLKSYRYTQQFKLPVAMRWMMLGVSMH